MMIKPKRQTSFTYHNFYTNIFLVHKKMLPLFKVLSIYGLRISDDILLSLYKFVKLMQICLILF